MSCSRKLTLTLNVLAYNMKRVMNIMGASKLLEAMRAMMAKSRSNFARAGGLRGAFRRSQSAIRRRIAALARKTGPTARFGSADTKSESNYTAWATRRCRPHKQRVHIG